MATSKEYRDYVLEQFRLLNITCRPMMGEYLLYCDGVLFGGIYDGRVLIKMTEGNAKYVLPQAIPYAGAKPMYLLEDLEQMEVLREIVLVTCKSLPVKKRK